MYIHIQPTYHLPLSTYYVLRLEIYPYIQIQARCISKSSPDPKSAYTYIQATATACAPRVRRARTGCTKGWRPATSALLELAAPKAAASPCRLHVSRALTSKTWISTSTVPLAWCASSAASALEGLPNRNRAVWVLSQPPKARRGAQGVPLARGKASSVGVAVMLARVPLSVWRGRRRRCRAPRVVTRI
jgi:hypothetical protein